MTNFEINTLTVECYRKNNNENKIKSTCTWQVAYIELKSWTNWKKLNKWKQYQQPAIIQLPNIQPNKLIFKKMFIILPVKIKRYKILCNDFLTDI